MAERIEGLSIGLDLDTMKLDSGLTSLKSKMSLVNSELRNNLSAFDRGDKSVEKYQTRIDGLNKKLEVQKTVVDSAHKSYEKMVKEHGEGSKEAEKAARNYNHESAALNNLERQIGQAKRELKQFTQEQKIVSSGWTKAGDSLINFGSGLKSISDRTKDIGLDLTKKITMPAVGAASALAGITLAKGFGRLIGIDTARAKLTGLGHDVEGVEKIMQSALDSVRGTAFGLDVAATTAANAVAAGVKEGKELTRYLSLTGDAAAIAGAGLGEMGSILNKVQTSNKAYNGELQQLSDRGLPIYQWLAKEAGVTAEAVFKLASDGKISSEMLLNAIEKNIGGAAQKIGEEQFTAGVANMWAAVGRLGASFLDAGGKGGGFFSQLKPLVADFTGRIDSMGDIAEKAGVKFGELFTGFIDKAKSVKAMYDNLSPSVQNLINKTALVGTAVTVGLGPALIGLGLFGGIVAKAATGLGGFLKLIGKAKVLGGFGKNVTGGTKSLGLFARILTALTGPVGWIIGGITALGAGFVVAYKKSETFRNIIDGLKDSFVGALSNVKEFLTTNPKFLSFVDSVKDGFVSLKDKTVEAFHVVSAFFMEKVTEVKSFWNSEGQQILAAFSNIFTGIWAVTEPVLKGIVSAVKWAFPYVKSIIIGALKVGLFIIKSIWGNIQGVFDGGLKVIMGLTQVFSGLFTGDFSKNVGRC